MEGRGGVVHVRYRGDACAPDVFLETIKSIFENLDTDGPRASVRIDPDFYTTHYLGDVLQAISRKVGCTLEVGRASSPIIEELHVASGNSSQGNLDLTVQGIHVHTSDHSDAPALRDRKIAVVSRAVEAFLSSGCFMIVLKDAPLKDQAAFWRDLWDATLQNLVKQGLLLIKMINDEKVYQGKHPDEPEPELTIVLPAGFDEIRQGHVMEDLADILLREVKRSKNLDMSPEVAALSVKGFVYSHDESVAHLHNKWSGILIKLVRDAN